jgi:hypothetical protein
MRTRTENQWTSGSTEHDRLSPLLDGDEARHTVQCVSVRSFSGFADRPSRGFSGTYSLPLVLAFGILPPRLFLLMVFLMRILLVVESRGSLNLVLVSFLGPRWFRGLPASSLV